MTRDAAGVPHIRASSWWDALYGLGYFHAIDRGTQLLFSRTIAGGEGAGRISARAELFETDCFFRRIGLHLDLEREVAAMDPKTLDQVLVYCAGVNDGLTAKGTSLPIWATGYEPRPWTPAAVVLVGRLLNLGGLAIGQLENEILLVKLIHAGVSDAALTELFSARVANADFDLLRQVRIVNHLSDDALELLVDLPRLAGSNAWAVAPSRSATGHALLAGDPHLEVNRLPAIWYEAVLQWDDGYLMGATLPGMPLVSVGRNAGLAWSVTYLKADTIDLYIEDCRRLADGGWQYRRQQRWHDFRVRHERLGAEPKRRLTCRYWRMMLAPWTAFPMKMGCTSPRPGWGVISRRRKRSAPGSACSRASTSAKRWIRSPAALSRRYASSWPIGRGTSGNRDAGSYRGDRIRTPDWFRWSLGTKPTIGRDGCQ